MFNKKMIIHTLALVALVVVALPSAGFTAASASDSAATAPTKAVEAKMSEVKAASDSVTAAPAKAAEAKMTEVKAASDSIPAVPTKAGETEMTEVEAVSDSVTKEPAKAAEAKMAEIKTNIEDDAITVRVKAALLKEVPAINPADIHVRTDDGMVTLSGVVKTPAEFEKAEKAAKAVEGVKKVNNLLEVTLEIKTD